MIEFCVLTLDFIFLGSRILTWEMTLQLSAVFCSSQEKNKKTLPLNKRRRRKNFDQKNQFLRIFEEFFEFWKFIALNYPPPV